MERVIVEFSKASSVGSAWYGEGQKASFGQAIADKLVKQKVARIVGNVKKKNVDTRPKAQAVDTQVTSGPPGQSDNKMVGSGAAPTEGSRVKLK